MTDGAEDGSVRRPSSIALLSLGALGIVYGDIGTSPLYAMRESFTGAGHELAVTEDHILGVLSLIFWSLVIVISIKYLIFVMRSNNDGEGGILALTSLVTPPEGAPTTGARRGRWALIMVGLFGTALLYGDGMITPAISVLSAVEGTEVATPRFSGSVIPIAVVILIALFAVQHRGTGTVGRIFGPVMVVWFTVLGVLGLTQIVTEPGVLRALDPSHAVRFFADTGGSGFLALGSVFLVVTGGEALYADMGHFGRRPIGWGWFGMVLPGLVLNYFGQGALLIARPEAIDHPFYRLAPDWGLYPLVVLATIATVIASQALISGVFSLTTQASQYGYSPRIKVTHTSTEERGQIYVPAVNWLLMVACVGLVIGFRSSDSLAAAYGVAVTMTMVITTVIFYAVSRERFGWSRPLALSVSGAFLVVDLAFFGANIPKIPHGGWFPLVVGGGVFALLTTWKTGRRLVGERIARGRTPLPIFVDGIMTEPPVRVPGIAVYMFSLPGVTPPALIANLRYNKALHERVLVVAVVTRDVPRVLPVRRVTKTDLGHGIEQWEIHYGFAEEPDVLRALTEYEGLAEEDLTFFLGKETVLVTEAPGMAKWREHLYAYMSRNATSAARYFNLPAENVFEVGTQVEL